MQKFLPLLLAFVLCTAVTGCKHQTAAPVASGEPVIETPAPSDEATNVPTDAQTGENQPTETPKSAEGHISEQEIPVTEDWPTAKDFALFGIDSLTKPEGAQITAMITPEYGQILLTLHGTAEADCMKLAQEAYDKITQKGEIYKQKTDVSALAFEAQSDMAAFKKTVEAIKAEEEPTDIGTSYTYFYRADDKSYSLSVTHYTADYTAPGTATAHKAGDLVLEMVDVSDYYKNATWN